LRKWQNAIDGSLLKYQRAVNLAAAGWQPLGVTDPTPGWLRPTIDLEVDRIAADVKRAADRYSIKQPAKVVTGISEQQWLDAIENYAMPSRHFIGLDPANINERSKPVGLTTSHKYTDNDGDTIEVNAAHHGGDGVTAVLKATDSDSGEYASVYVNAVDGIPLALNMLGHDRPHILSNFETTVGEATHHGVVIVSTEHRDRTAAAAIAYLKSVDRYDQRQAERKAKEDAKAKAEAAAKAKRDAEYAHHKRESYERAKVTYADAIRDQIASGITPESVAKVQSALSAYETARRKLEGLPS
jgi:hypothetical protein